MPIVDRFDICYMAHNTNYILQQELTRYAIGTKDKTTFTGEKLHEELLHEYEVDKIYDKKDMYILTSQIPYNEIPKRKKAITKHSSNEAQLLTKEQIKKLLIQSTII